MKNLRVVDHPLLACRLTTLRDSSTSVEAFARMAELAGRILAVESMRYLSLHAVQVETPLEMTEGAVLKKPVCLIPVLRAGLSLLDPFRSLLPEASVGHIGIARNEETLEADVYVERLPSNLAESTVLLLDPMLATGHSSCAAIQRIKQCGVSDLTLVCCVAAPEGVSEVNNLHPDVQIITASLDRQLNEKGYILPGLGDFGDRLYGTL